VSHLDYVSEDELTRLLSMVVDVENLFTCVRKEEDVDTKQVYFYLFRVRNALFSLTLHLSYALKLHILDCTKSECS